MPPGGLEGETVLEITDFIFSYIQMLKVSSLEMNFHAGGQDTQEVFEGIYSTACHKWLRIAFFKVNFFWLEFVYRTLADATDLLYCTPKLIY